MLIFVCSNAGLSSWPWQGSFQTLGLSKEKEKKHVLTLHLVQISGYLESAL